MKKIQIYRRRQWRKYKFIKEDNDEEYKFIEKTMKKIQIYRRRQWRKYKFIKEDNEENTNL